jgi:NAD(P)H-hydrate epimerase
VGEAHHDAFAATDGADPEWPLWYAHRMAGRARALLGSDLTESRLVFLLVAAARRPLEEGQSWPRAYARFMVEDLRSDPSA